MTVAFRIRYDAASLMEPSAVGEAGSRTVDFSPQGFESPLRAGTMVAWLLQDELMFEDEGLDDPELDSFELQTHVLHINGGTQSVGLELTFSLPIESANPDALLNAISGAIFVMYWTGEGDSTHPDEGLGLYWFNGEMNHADINGTVIHER